MRDYYRQMGWGEANLDDPTGFAEAGSELEARRRSAETALKNLDVGAQLLPDNRRLFVKRRKEIAGRIRAASEIDEFDQIDEDIGTLRADLDGQNATAEARIKAQAALEAAIAKRDGIAAKLDEGAYSFLANRIATARAAIASGKTEVEFEAAEKAANDLLPVIDQAKTYGETFFDWMRSTAAFIERSVDAGDQPDIITLRDQVKADAAGLSAAGRFGDAGTKLDDFKADARIDGGDFDASAKFYVVYDEYRKTHQTMCEKVLAAGGRGRIRQASGYERSFATVKEEAFNKGNYDAAAKKLQELIDWCTPRRKVAKSLSLIDAKLSREASFRTNVLNPMNDKLEEEKFTSANNILVRFARGENAEGANPELERLAELNFSYLIDGRLEARKTALAALLVDPEKTQLDDAWNAHVLAAAENPPNEADMKTQAAIIRNLFNLEGAIGAQKEAQTIIARQPSVARYSYLSDFAASMTAKNFAQAKTDIQAAVPLLRDLVVYLSKVEEVRNIRDVLPADPAALREGLKTALDAAEVKAMAKDPSGATTDLSNVISSTDYLTIAQEVADYNALLARVEKEQTRVLKLLGTGGPKGAVEDGLDAAKTHATGTHRYDLAYDALTDHLKTLSKAKAFAAVQRQATGVKEALLRATTTPPESEQVFGPGSGREDMKAQFDAAELLATNSRFDDATAAFQTFLTDCKGYCDAIATAFEAADGVGSNAGHSIGRHGPDIDSADLIKRLTTGQAPDGKESFTSASSKFKDIQDWVAGREIAAAAALNAGIDINAKTVSPPFADDLTVNPPIIASPEQKGFIVEHGKAIDEAFVGREPKTKYIKESDIEDPPGSGTMKKMQVNEFVQDKTYETYEEMSGLTRAYVNFMFECDPIDVYNDATGATETRKAQDVAEYVAFFRENKRERGEAEADPPTVPGRWVMMQQYPVVDGWDDLTKSYTTDPPDMIP
ncbi:MAG: hypothetical protein AAGG09_03660 [Pseudomonadota bacterium]